MKRTSFNAYIDRGDFTNMFVEMGWNHPDNSPLDELEIDEQAYSFKPVADKCGFHIYCCEIEAIPTQGICKKIDTHLRKYGYDYICIFREKDSTHDLWMVPVKNNEKRELVKTEYDCGAQANFLYSKIADFTFALTDRVLITDVKNKVQAAFLMNSERVTKAFYSQFRTEHNTFASFITGLENKAQCEWYTSVMLNRLMFCYFIQKKGFLDNDTNYLSNKLDWVKEQHSGGTFYSSFYKGFLCALFHDGLNNPQHDSPEFLAKYGRIPYLNGGMFDVHQLERDHQDLDIADAAFERLFDFFNKWHWHLDTRLTATGKDINPDVLGYIFEQYINDRAEMGAYYTKEDITEYIAKNCIIPFLFDRAAETTSPAFTPAGEVWSLLKNSGDKYIYDAVKKGYSPDWLNEIPDYIANGVDTSSPDLLARRARWNEKTDAPFALPTEIWRETVERFQRCDMLKAKIASGGIQNINDFITYNLDIRQFIADIIAQTGNHRLVAHFYEAIKNITVLDPTCGSGAFLFAALNILEPLYEACLDRMAEFHAANPRLFRDELAEITDHYNSNREYFISKSIILRNLYGVDIMREATEIAKLRLFLKLVAVVEVNRRAPNLGLDPLPDIDFNIKCGNTLVGFTSEQEAINAISSKDLFAADKYGKKIKTELQVVANAFLCFQEAQIRAYDDNTTINATKKDLKLRLASLNDLFNQFLHSLSGNNDAYDIWLEKTKPFNWISEFYQIVNNNNGFDVIIGNPPYLEARDVDYQISQEYETYASNAIHALCIERSIKLSRGNVSMIVPMSLTSTQRMQQVQKIIEHNRNAWYSNFAWRPAKLFDEVNRALSIFIANNFNTQSETSLCHTTGYIKWTSDNRGDLLNRVIYTKYTTKRSYYWIPKLRSAIDFNILNKIIKNSETLYNYSTRSSSSKIYYRSTGGLYWKVFTNFPPLFECNGIVGKSSREKELNVTCDVARDALIGLFSSNLYWLWYTLTSNLRDLNPADLNSIKFPTNLIDSSTLSNLGKKYIKDLKQNSTMLTRKQKTKGVVKTQSFKVSSSKNIIDEIDTYIAKHYGFSEEELDFIINYDIKYRMGEGVQDDE